MTVLRVSYWYSLLIRIVPRGQHIGKCSVPVQYLQLLRALIPEEIQSTSSLHLRYLPSITQFNLCFRHFSSFFFSLCGLQLLPSVLPLLISLPGPHSILRTYCTSLVPSTSTILTKSFQQEATENRPDTLAPLNSF